MTTLGLLGLGLVGLIGARWIARSIDRVANELKKLREKIDE